MRRTVLFLTILTATAALISLSSMPALAISGECVNCHTMHNSQDGAPEVQVLTGGTLETSDIPQPYLLKASCIACHSGTVGQGKINDFEAPIVLHISNPTGQGKLKTLAGGDFYWVATGLGADDTTGHNVAGVSGQDTQNTLFFTPPGFDTNATPGALGAEDGSINGQADTWAKQLTCAGKYGCHGNHTGEDAGAGIFGAHHSNTGLTATKADSPQTVGSSYRFLGGINGLEDEDWNWEEDAQTHNEYFGADLPNGRDQGNLTYGNNRTISYSCAQCHGDFHSQIDDETSGSPWLRHPTDIALPSTGEYACYNPDGDTPGEYSVEAPLARPSVPDISREDVILGNDIVMCLSCHRAHGSPYADLMRWQYTGDGMQAGVGTDDTGCFTCHTHKNADQEECS
ncbi:MAG: cytochrome c3 family protein [Planctomycetota bacterium]